MRLLGRRNCARARQRSNRLRGKPRAAEFAAGHGGRAAHRSAARRIPARIAAIAPASLAADRRARTRSARQSHRRPTPPLQQCGDPLRDGCEPRRTTELMAPPYQRLCLKARFLNDAAARRDRRRPTATASSQYGAGATHSRERRCLLPADLGPNNERLEELRPDLVNALRELVVQYRQEGIVARRQRNSADPAGAAVLARACNTRGGIRRT